MSASSHHNRTDYFPITASQELRSARQLDTAPSLKGALSQVSATFKMYRFAVCSNKTMDASKGRMQGQSLGTVLIYAIAIIIIRVYNRG